MRVEVTPFITMEFITLFGTHKREPTVLDKIKDAVTQTKENFTERIQDLVQGKKEIDAEMLDELEAIMRILTNHPRKLVALEAYGLKIVEQVPLAPSRASY